MIKQVNGRWRSYRTPQETEVKLASLYKDLSPEEREVVDEILKEYGIKGKSPIINTAYEVEWDPSTGPPVPIRQWVDDTQLLGETAQTLYPVLKQDVIELFEGGYSECILTGCIDQNAIVQLSDGSLPRLGDLIGQQTSVLTADAETGLSHHKTTPGVDSGVRKVLKLTLKNGMEVKLTPDHRVLTQRGWVRAEHLTKDDSVVTPRKVTYMPSCLDLTDAEVKLLAYWVTDGSIEPERSRARYCDGRIETVKEVTESLRSCGFNTTSEPYEKNGAWEVLVAKFKSSGFWDWAIRRGLSNKKTATAEVPEDICRAPLKQVALFINRVWAAEGTVSAAKSDHAASIQLGMKSERFIRQMQLLLLRFGIQSRITESVGERHGKEWRVWTLYLSNKTDIELFLKEIGTVFSKEQECSAVEAKVALIEKANRQDDNIPMALRDFYQSLKLDEISEDWRVRLHQRDTRPLSRQLLEEFAVAYPEQAQATLEKYSSDIRFVPVKSVTEHHTNIPVADIGVPGMQRFVANGLTAHNSIGWGKDYFATTCVLRVLYELLCLKNPQKSLGLGAGEPIHIVPISHRKEAAKRVVFGGVAKKMNLSPFFRGRFEETMDEIRFRDKNIYIVGGSSQDAGALGLNVFCSVMDELNFMGRGKATTGSASGEHYDKAQMIYDALARRVKSRYQHAGVKGLVFLVSSKRATDDFTERKIKESLSDPTVFVRDYATWDVKPSHYNKQKWYRVCVSPKEGRSRILGENEAPPENTTVFTFPEDFLKDFQRDPDGATRDIAGIATDAVSPFIVERAAIDESMKPERPSVFKIKEWDTSKTLLWNLDAVMAKNARGESVPVCCPGAVRHAHLDMSKNLCATGLTIGHRAGSLEVLRTMEDGKKKIEDAPIVHIDATLRIVAPTGGEIDHEAVRGLIYDLRSHGFPILSISMDQWCFTPNAQLLRQKGFRVTEQSVVKTLLPYMATRNILYERRLEMPIHDFLKKELYEIELNKEGTKVDHPRAGTKDLADSLAGVCFFLTENIKGGRPVSPSKGITDSPFISRQNTTGGPTYIGNGDFVWPDEIKPTKDSDGNDDTGLPSWILI